jgi:hypothetical protein
MSISEAQVVRLDVTGPPLIGKCAGVHLKVVAGVTAGARPSVGRMVGQFMRMISPLTLTSIFLNGCAVTGCTPQTFTRPRLMPSL